MPIFTVLLLHYVLNILKQLRDNSKLNNLIYFKYTKHNQTPSFADFHFFTLVFIFIMIIKNNVSSTFCAI